MKLILLLLLSATIFGGTGLYSSYKDAQDDFEQLYGGGDTVTFTEKKSPKNSMLSFIQYLADAPNKKLFIVYSAKEQSEAAEIMRDFICRKRGFNPGEVKPSKTGVFVVKAADYSLPLTWDYKTIYIGSPATSEVINSLQKKGKINISATKAQFRLLAKPNCIAIASGNDKMFTELTRVFIRLHKEFDEETYSYFFVN